MRYSNILLSMLGIAGASGSHAEIEARDIIKDIKAIRDGTSENFRVLDADAMKELGTYSRISFKDSKREDAAREWSGKLQPMEGVGRRLQGGTTGQISDLLRGGCSASEVYENTAYDDAYQPICRCVQDIFSGQIILDCDLNNNSCQAASDFNQNVTDGSELCTSTVERFYFSDTDGDMRTKSSCTLCKNTNDEIEDLCEENYQEVCTFVDFAFDEADGNDQPVACRLYEYPSDPTEEVKLCEECEICGGAATDSASGTYGIQHSCFGLSAGASCDTGALAHVHNLLPALGADRPTTYTIGGAFEETCDNVSPDRTLYDRVDYNAGLSTVCDCDLSRGRISCDLHLSQCFANTCSAISEVFFFSDAGDYQSKWTVNWVNGLWTETQFDQSSGRATQCGVLAPTSNNELVYCDNCDVCENTEGEVGLSFDCFGLSTTSCETSDGRAEFNFAFPSNGAPSYPIITAPRVPTQNNGNGNGGLSRQGVFGLFAAGLLIAGVFTALLVRKPSRATQDVTDDATVLSAADTEMVPTRAITEEDEVVPEEEGESTEPRIV